MLEPEEYERLYVLAKAVGQTVSAAARRIILEALAKVKRK